MIKDLRPEDPASVGPYRLLGYLGAGGMGQVYLGRSAGGRLVAIKLIRPELAEERGFHTRFTSEITAAKNVSGVYTAAVVDADADAERPWMATVYVAGPSLTDAVEENGPLPVESVLTLAGGLAEALEAIHRAGLVHRDLKPSNVLLAADGPRVIDFGISLAAERSNLTTTGMVMGSPGFMSPEQAMGQREVGAPTDVFSLGAVLAYAATGQNPFGGGPTPALLYRVVNEVPDLTAVPARLSPLIEKCLEKNPADRPTPAGVLALLGDDVGVLSDEWLPPSVTQTMVRYTPARRSAEQGLQPTGAGSAAPSSPALGTPVAADWEATALAPAASVPPATVGQRGAPPEPGAVTAVDFGPPGGPGGPPPTRRQPPQRRWLWPVTGAAAAAVVIAVVAILLTSHSHGGTPTVNSTASLAGNATKAPATQAASATPSATRTAAPTVQPASQATASAPATASSPTTAPTKSAAPTTAAPTSAAPTTAAPTQTSTPTGGTPSSPATAATTSAPTTSASAQAPTTPASNPTSSSAAAPSSASSTATAG